MWHEILSEGSKSLWREIGVDMLRKGAATLVVEGVKAGVDVFKQRRIRRDVYEFDQWKKAQEDLRDKDKGKADPDKTQAAPEASVPTPESPAESGETLKPDPPTEDEKPPVEDPPETRPGDPV